MRNTPLLSCRQHLATFFQGLGTWERAEYSLLVALAAVFPFSWRAGLWVMSLWLLAGVGRMVARRQHGNGYDAPVRRLLALPMALFATYLLSMAYTERMAEGWDLLLKMLPIALVPCYLLVGKVGYLTPRRLRGVGYAFVVGSTLLGAAFLLAGLWRVVAKGTPIYLLHQTMGFVPHHTYAAMYFLVALSFLYLEHRGRGAAMPRARKAWMAASGALLALAAYGVQSRSGLACLALWLLAAAMDVMLFRTRRRRGVALASLALLLGAGALLLGGKSNRLAQSIKTVFENKDRDVRVEIWSNAAQVIAQHPLLGVGAGDRFAALEHHHERHFLPSPYYGWHPFNPHNQFLDAWLAAGLLAFLLTVTLFVWPAVHAWRSRPRRWLLLCFLVVVAVASLVECVLARQMGIIFFAVAYSLLVVGGAAAQPRPSRPKHAKKRR